MSSGSVQQLSHDHHSTLWEGVQGPAAPQLRPWCFWTLRGVAADPEEGAVWREEEKQHPQLVPGQLVLTDEAGQGAEQAA